MCEFVSWIEVKDKILFLTAYDIFETKQGRKLQACCQSPDDYMGHGAIRFFYEISSNTGINRECTDFSSPDNFPPEIGKAIKEGKMRGLGLSKQLLLPRAWAEYKKIEQPALAEYEKIQQSAWAEYEKIEQPALAEYEKIRQPVFWDLFANPKNRVKKWR